MNDFKNGSCDKTDPNDETEKSHETLQFQQGNSDKSLEQLNFLITNNDNNNILNEKIKSAEKDPAEKEQSGYIDLKNHSHVIRESLKSNADYRNYTSQWTDKFTQFRNIIDSLKLEISEEKIKMQKPSKLQECLLAESNHKCCTQLTSTFNEEQLTTNYFSDNLDEELEYDKNLIEYEKQLQRYQKTLNMAQNAKKSSIRKQMLAKALKLKLLEVENQCNIELLRIKQNLQCLEPLKIIADSWKTEKGELSYDLDKYELLPLFPELYVNCRSATKSDNETIIEQH